MKLLTRVLRVFSWSFIAPALALLVGLCAAGLVALLCWLLGFTGMFPLIFFATAFLLAAIVADRMLSDFAKKKGIY